jgi:RHH-type proline utilization regulon transcriptional repressor/proline dehydrogenase/delta 1-pyrroline-5-carboxylate dehydrogenase
MTEFFGPVLAVMRAENLDHAIELVNATGYGLTSGLESLDRREQEKWKEGVKAGNLYINKGTTGAIVLRQPFGGMGKSALGVGIKAGSPNYVYQFMDIEETAYPPYGDIEKETRLLRLANEWEIECRWSRFEDDIRKDMEKTVRAMKSCVFQYEAEFGREHDYFNLRGQDNLFRYLPKGRVVIRVHPDDTLFEVLARIAAAKIARCHPIISLVPGVSNRVTQFLESHHGKRLVEDAPVVEQNDEELCGMIPKVQRIRYAAPDRVPDVVYERAAETGFYISRAPVYMEGRLELLQYIQEQAISHNYHRYGNLGERSEL